MYNIHNCGYFISGGLQDCKIYTAFFRFKKDELFKIGSRRRICGFGGQGTFCGGNNKTIQTTTLNSHGGGLANACTFGFGVHFFPQHSATIALPSCMQHNHTVGLTRGTPASSCPAQQPAATPHLTPAMGPHYSLVLIKSTVFGGQSLSMHCQWLVWALCGAQMALRLIDFPCTPWGTPMARALHRFTHCV